MWKWCLQVVNLLRWFLYRRWKFKSWTKDLDKEPLVSNMYRCDIARCRTYTTIYRDILRIMNK